MEDQKDTLMIGEGVSLTGTIKLSGVVYVYGEVNGEISAHEIRVGSSGKVTGEVQVDIADIRGEVNNSIHAKETLVIRSTGKVVGNISYQSVEIEHGGLIDGKIEKIPAGNVVNIPLNVANERD